VKTEELLDLLASHRTIGQAPRGELAWIAANGTLRHFEPGEIVSRQTDVVDGLYIILRGRMTIYLNRGPGHRKGMEWRAGDVTGLLPYSRLRTPPGDSIVDEAIDAVYISREDLPALVRSCYEVTAILVHEMTDRARQFTSSSLRDEKMVSLGKLAAGLAHEVNNPASAALRDAKSLASALVAAEEAGRKIFSSGLTVQQLAEMDAIRNICQGSPDPRLTSGLSLADREDALTEWLQAHGVDTDLAEDLARTTATFTELDRLARVLQGPALGTALRWITAACVARSLVADIGRAASRIQHLVAAVKGYTHMDRAPDEEPVYIPAGLTDAVALLEGKAKAKSVAIRLDIEPDLPSIVGRSVEINQIWMNLIDNAVDAAPEGGHVTVNASRNGSGVVVRVVDDGAGIPPEIKEHIYDPFFTTKDVGEGTGLGLDIVQRSIQWHHAEIELDTRPGRTEFRVRLPLDGGRSTQRQ